MPFRLTEVNTVWPCLQLLSCEAPYLVRMIKPNLIVSHDWHVQPICQRSITVTRLSEAVDRVTGFASGRPRTCFARETGGVIACSGVFARTF